MQQSSYLPDSSEKWDTNWARNHLKISKDQLCKLENIPEWLPVADSEKAATVKEISTCVLQKEPLPLNVLPENLNKDNPIEKEDSCPKGRKQIRTGAQMDSNFDFGISYSQPEMGSFKSSPVFPKPVEKLGDKILTHKYLKQPVPNKPENDVWKVGLDASQPGDPKTSEAREETSGKPELSGKNSPIPCDVEVSNPVDEEISGNENSKESSDVGSKVNTVIEENLNEKPVVESNEEMPNSKGNTTSNGVEDSFRCASIPCGQPVNTERDPSSSPLDSSGEAANKQGEGLEKVDASVIQQTLDKAKSDLLSSPHNVGNSGTKRKRKSKGETPKHLKDAKRSRNLNIRFTSDQVKHMLEILRLTHS